MCGLGNQMLDCNMQVPILSPADLHTHTMPNLGNFRARNPEMSTWICTSIASLLVHYPLIWLLSAKDLHPSPPSTNPRTPLASIPRISRYIYIYLISKQERKQWWFWDKIGPSNIPTMKKFATPLWFHVSHSSPCSRGPWHGCRFGHRASNSCLGQCTVSVLWLHFLHSDFNLEMHYRQLREPYYPTKTTKDRISNS